MSYRLGVVDEQSLLDNLPFAYAVWSTKDFSISLTNKAFHRTFRTEQHDLSNLELFDIIGDLETSLISTAPLLNPIDEATANYPTEGFAKFKRFDDTFFLGWFQVTDIVGQPSLRSGFVFEDYDLEADDPNWTDLLTTRLSIAFDIALDEIAHELNNSLALVTASVEQSIISQPVRNALLQPLERLKLIGVRVGALALQRHLRHEPDLKGYRGAPLKLRHADKPTETAKSTRVLIVDDDPQLLDSLAELLRMDDFIVFEANSKRIAYEIIMVSKIDIAVIDLRLGNENGRIVADALLRVKPELGIIFMTGYSTLIPEIQREGQYTVLKKPFQIEQLVVELRKEYAI